MSPRRPTDDDVPVPKGLAGIESVVDTPFGRLAAVEEELLDSLVRMTAARRQPDPELLREARRRHETLYAMAKANRMRLDAAERFLAQLDARPDGRLKRSQLLVNPAVLAWQLSTLKTAQLQDRLGDWTSPDEFERRDVRDLVGALRVGTWLTLPTAAAVALVSDSWAAAAAVAALILAVAAVAALQLGDDGIERRLDVVRAAFPWKD